MNLTTITVVAAIACTAYSANVHATPGDGQEWDVLARGKSVSFETRMATIGYTKDRTSGADTITVIGRMYHYAGPHKDTMAFVRWNVTWTDCAKGYGHVVTTEVDGTYLYENPFVLAGGNPAGSIADVLCGAHKLAQEKMKKSAAPAASTPKSNE